MSGYFYTLLVASVCGAMCVALSFGGFEKYIKYICSLVCICLMIVPFREIDIEAIKDSYEISFSEQEGESSLYAVSSQLAEERAESYITEIVFSQFGIKPLSTDIKIDWTQTEPLIEDITVSLSHEDMQKAEATKEYLMFILGGKVNVVEN